MAVTVSFETASALANGLTPFQLQPSGVQAFVDVTFVQCSAGADQLQTPPEYGVTST
jgi:hypothetical protein